MSNSNKAGHQPQVSRGRIKRGLKPRKDDFDSRIDHFPQPYEDDGWVDPATVAAPSAHPSAKKPGGSAGVNPSSPTPAATAAALSKKLVLYLTALELDFEPGNPEVITQADLTLLANLRHIAGWASEVRLALLERLVAGADVEPGPLAAHLTTQSICSSSWGHLRELLGDEAVEDLRAQMPLTIHQVLMIEGADKAVPADAAKKLKARRSRRNPNNVNP